MPDSFFFFLKGGGGGGEGVGGQGRPDKRQSLWAGCGLLLEWILQNKAGHLMVFTQCSVLNRDSPGEDENRSPFVRADLDGTTFAYDCRMRFLERALLA